MYVYVYIYLYIQISIQVNMYAYFAYVYLSDTYIYINTHMYTRGALTAPGSGPLGQAGAHEVHGLPGPRPVCQALPSGTSSRLPTGHIDIDVDIDTATDIDADIDNRLSHGPTVGSKSWNMDVG